MTFHKRTVQVFFLTTAVVGVVAGTGCTSLGHSTANDESHPLQGPALTQAALEFGDWQLPSGAKVLLARDDYHRDPNFKLAVEVSPADLTWMLNESKFSKPFTEGVSAANREIIAGPPLSTSPHAKEAQDMFVSKEGDSMIRAVVIDERTANVHIVHLEFRGQ
ncbi:MULTISPECIES: hypothetical protein [unclassified Nocardia]|uniref:hypothetical protein n=1 Tax=unclassified Nocardia TaxID=2637762 RepID=UPI001C4EBE3F|nr:hypothetical protein [Nocardia sp. MH4]